MDIVKALRELYDEKKRLDAAISSLEARLKAARTNSAAKPEKGRRGRKSMNAAERLEVSKRMTLYWESRRAQVRTSKPELESSSLENGQRASSTSAS
jgi:hypothetical protein